jgi:geranyl-CoA carboxylase alpha subunit
MRRFETILVANRGEITLRVLRTAKALGYRTVAVYSTADADAPHVHAADDAVLLGPAPAADSYLSGERILAAARASGAGAIHPGYGFLSENATFARSVEDAGLVFIGPTPEAIALMGNKTAAKRRMLEAGVPCVPGYEGHDQSDEAFLDAAARLGFPVMVKAAAGGGGRGMRLVHDAADLPAALRSARSEAKNAFDSDELILERALLRPRHVEIQVFADAHGHTVHLGERDCSVQRRHQKIVEEAPCPAMTADLRERMGHAAVEAARSIGYRGAGTVEFLLDQHGEFYFLEMNTRLQVEHPVTELVTGLDLVALQLRVAEGQPLGFTQEQVRLEGHAIEARLYAEDPTQGFLPASGRILHWQPPTGTGIRVDGGIRSGLVVPSCYDPLLAKVVAWGETRDAAIDRLVDALTQTQLFGIASNRQFLVDVLQRPAFRRGEATTALVEDEFPVAPAAPTADAVGMAVAAVLQFLSDRDHALERSVSPRTELLNWSSRGVSPWQARYRGDEVAHDMRVLASPGERYSVTVGGTTLAIMALQRDGHSAVFTVDGRRLAVAYCLERPGTVHLAHGHRTLVLRNALAYPATEGARSGNGRITALMHGALVEVFVSTGERVEKGARLGVLEAMKMQHEVRADVAGRVTSIAARPGTQVAAGDLLFDIESEAGADAPA